MVMAGRPRGTDGLANSYPVPSYVPVVRAGRVRLTPTVTEPDAGLVPCTPGGSGRLAAARSATAPTAATTTMASNMFGAIWFFMARLLTQQLRSRSLAWCLGRFGRHLRRYEQRRLAASPSQMNFHGPRTPCGVRVLLTRQAGGANPDRPGGTVEGTDHLPCDRPGVSGGHLGG